MSNPSGQGPVGQPGPGGSYGGHPPSSGGTSAAPVGGAPAPSAPSAQNLNQIVSSSCLLYRLLCSLFPSPSPALLVSEAPDLHVSLTICPCVCMHNVCGGLSLKTSPSQFPSVALPPRDSQAPFRLCLLPEATPRNICICWSAQIFLQSYQWPGNLLCPGHQMESAVFEPRFLSSFTLWRGDCLLPWANKVALARKLPNTVPSLLLAAKPSDYLTFFTPHFLTTTSPTFLVLESQWTL